jgi:hypothetical protein
LDSHQHHKCARSPYLAHCGLDRQWNDYLGRRRCRRQIQYWRKILRAIRYTNTNSDCNTNSQCNINGYEYSFLYINTNLNTYSYNDGYSFPYPHINSYGHEYSFPYPNIDSYGYGYSVSYTNING